MDSVIKIHHVGYLVKNITDSIEAFKKLGYSIESVPFYDEDRKTMICFLLCGEVRIECVSPNRESDLYPLLKKYRNTPYHICYEVANIKNAIDVLQEKGFHLFSEEARALAISQTAKVAFLMHADIGMIELVETGT